MTKKINLLFICSRNQWRSPTAENIWKKHPEYNTRSSGTSPNAKKTVSPSDIRWADKIFVMEKKHKNRLVAKFTRMLEYKPIYVLNIPDEYAYMDPELIEELKEIVGNLLK
ncbi:low molecular weight protein tyrosine phosphatase family protein [Desulfosediminicola flagellatus]|uniref:low molecular weight protein tyrosine phosphatase family protein n=1 Tax=Desulfosediminicola flagellatus TaxID=2569541 RepID=UPI001593A0F1|nr:phosphotyrosine protein phosphatase [Desulfosediminicola flagellatus]